MQSPTSTPLLDPLIRAEGHIVGSGALHGPITGEVTIEPVDIDTITIHLRHLQLHGSAGRHLVLATSPTAASCGAGGIVIDEGEITTEPTQNITARTPSVNEYMDLSNLPVLAIREADECTAAATAVADLHWTVPTDLAAVTPHDTGSRYGAHGHVTDSSADRPETYTVASDDLLDDVATRFGLTPDELLWLTPFRSRGDSGLVYTGEVLNLDPAAR